MTDPQNRERQATLSIRMSVGEQADPARAAEDRGLGFDLADYVRSVMAEQARPEIERSELPVTRLSPADQLAFWNALHTPAELNEGLKRLAEIIRTSRIDRSAS